MTSRLVIDFYSIFEPIFFVDHCIEINTFKRFTSHSTITHTTATHNHHTYNHHTYNHHTQLPHIQPSHTTTIHTTTTTHATTNRHRCLEQLERQVVAQHEPQCGLEAVACLPLPTASCHSRQHRQELHCLCRL